jgi:glycosyltransferase involved in cell wall biosynthesis
MRIASIITSFTTGGAEMLACNLTEAFTTAGHSASILALSDAAQVGNPTDVEQNMMARVTRTGALPRSLARKNRNNWIGGAKALRRTLRVIKPDVIHAHTVRALPWIALARPGVPVILTHHNSRLPFHPRAFRVFDQMVFTYVAISDRCEAQMAGYARRPIRKILNAASPRFSTQTARPAPPRDPVILAVGTVSEQKDYPTLIRAAAPLVRLLARLGRRPDIRIAGGGAMIDDLRQLIRQEGVTEYVTLLGARNDVDALMQQADIFVNCSLWEGFPIALIEASMSGLPIVATQIEGNCELVIAGSNGELVPPSNPLALAKAIAAVIEEDETYAAMSQASLHAAKRFSIDNCAAAHLALYEEAIAWPSRHATPHITGQALQGLKR